MLSDSLKYFDKELENMLNTTIKWANINSGSWNYKGVSEFAELVKEEFASLDCSLHVETLADYKQTSLSGNKTSAKIGPLLHFSKHEDAKVRVLLTGHLDTVFPKYTNFIEAKVDGELLKGPGVADMKGGIVALCWALKYLESSEYAGRVGWDVILNPDEEIGSLSSSDYMVNVARSADLGLVYEPALDETGMLAGARNGSGKFTIVATGEAAHVGRAFSEGDNAIVAMTQILVNVDSLNGKRPGAIINIGLIQGGSAVNVVADTCVAKLDIRYKSEDDKLWIKESLDSIVNSYSGSCKLELEGDFYRPSKELSEKQLQIYNFIKNVGANIGQDISWKSTGGCCDGNNLASTGLRVVDTLGVIGGGIHSEKEYMVIASLAERAKLTAAILQHLAVGGLPW